MNITSKAGRLDLAFFLTMWFGQTVSLLGSQMTDFALGVWVFEGTGSATRFALITFFTYAPAILIGPLAGVLVDRWPRRRILILADSGAALSTLAIVLLVHFGLLQVWHIYLAATLTSALTAFQLPAYEASISLLIPQEHYGRANGLSEIGAGLVRVGAPALAGALLLAVGLEGVILLDLVSFVFAVVTLLLIRIPDPPQEGGQEQEPLWREALAGWRYIWVRPGLVGLMVFFALSNFLTGLVLVVFTPMVLSFTTPEVLGRVISLAVSGALVGGLLMAVWGGPKPRIHGVLLFQMLLGLAMVAGGLRAAVLPITLAGFVFWACVPIINGSNLAIWQRKVPPQMQGRVFAFRRLVAWSSLPVAFLLAGPLADGVFNPLFAVHGPLSGTWLAGVFGLGPGRGIGFMFSSAGLLTVVVALAGYAYPELRRLERDVPDAKLADKEEPLGE